ncbi:MAG: 2TM domain-containing protein, partial [Spirochaetales bacterium]|nr:2TM domain-containing protein [Spirochaetales bacterium]
RPVRRESRFASFHRYRDKILKRVEKGFTGFRVHFTAFAAVNIFFFVVWLVTGAGHPWFLYPLGAWSIGLLNHLNPVVQKYRQRREVTALPDLTEKETRYLKRMHAARTGFAAHAISAASFSAYLIMINAITGGGFPWALIPAAAMGVALILHWSGYGPKSRKMKREIQSWIAGDGGRRIDSPDPDGEERESPIVQEASALRRNILRQIEEMEKDHPAIAGDMRPLLDTYFQQVRQLAGKFQEIDTLLAQVPRTGLQQDRVRLKNRMEQVESDRLKEEYEKSILEIDRQLASIKELAHNGEVLELRLTSAVNLMKQLQLDLARVKGASLQNTASFGLLKEKSDELSRYIEDLESGYNELEKGL